MRLMTRLLCVALLLVLGGLLAVPAEAAATPVAMSDYAVVNVGDTVTVPVLANDRYEGSATVTASVVTEQPYSATTSADGQQVVVRTLPTITTAGFDIRYILDTADGESTGVIHVTVAQPPTTVDATCVARVKVIRVIAGHGTALTLTGKYRAGRVVHARSFATGVGAVCRRPGSVPESASQVAWGIFGDGPVVLVNRHPVDRFRVSLVVGYRSCRLDAETGRVAGCTSGSQVVRDSWVSPWWAR